MEVPSLSMPFTAMTADFYDAVTLPISFEYLLTMLYPSSSSGGMLVF